MMIVVIDLTIIFVIVTYIVSIFVFYNVWRERGMITSDPDIIVLLAIIFPVTLLYMLIKMKVVSTIELSKKFDSWKIK